LDDRPEKGCEVFVRSAMYFLLVRKSHLRSAGTFKRRTAAFTSDLKIEGYVGNMY